MTLAGRSSRPIAILLIALAFTARGFGHDDCPEGPARLTCDGLDPPALAGLAVTIDRDFTAVGAPGHLDATGAVCVFRRRHDAWSLEQTLLPVEPEPFTCFGTAVALSGDALLVGDEVNTVSVFRRDPASSRWVLETQLRPSERRAGAFGETLTLQGDVALIGAVADETVECGRGSAFVFRYDPTLGTWTEETRLVRESRCYESDDFGLALALDDDLAAIAAPLYGGVVYLFRYDGASWREVAALSSDTNDDFGTALALRDEELIVGAPAYFQSATGRALVYRRVGVETWSLVRTLVADDIEFGDGFGTTVALAGDVLAVGTPFQGAPLSEAGAVHVYDREGASWSLRGRYAIPGPERYDWLGMSIALDERSIIAGAPGDGGFSATPRDGAWVFPVDPVDDDCDRNGIPDRCDVDCNGSGAQAAYVYRWAGDRWMLDTRLTASDGAAYDDFGSAVALHDDVAVVGAEWADVDGENAVGAAYVFRRVGGVWTEEAKLVPPVRERLSHLGVAAAIHGDVLAVASATNYSGTARVYVYRHDDGHGWMLEATLDGPRYFGRAIALGDGVLAASGWSWQRSYHVILFEFDGAQWRESQVLVDDARYAFFGNALAVSGDRLVVGARAADPGQRDAGVVHVFRHDDATWREEASLRPSDPWPGDRFGWSVGVDGDLLVAGVRGDDDAGRDSGSAYVFAWDGATWREQAKLVSPDGADFDRFGQAVGISGARVVAAAPYRDRWQSDMGAVYAYTLPACGGDDGLDDLLRLLEAWGAYDPTGPERRVDRDANGVVDAADLLVVLRGTPR